MLARLGCLLGLSKSPERCRHPQCNQQDRSSKQSNNFMSNFQEKFTLRRVSVIIDNGGIEIFSDMVYLYANR
jgi:hypothetical protein